jgi:two-component system sensor histidine kinase DesK
VTPAQADVPAGWTGDERPRVTPSPFEAVRADDPFEPPRTGWRSVALPVLLAGVWLVHLDPAGAEREIGDVERLTREALSDVRSAVAGYRGVTLAGELANARAALRAAGITADLPTAVDDVPGDRRALFGWVIREGVTNVVRHSGARRCTVTVTPTTVEVRDDGHGRVADGDHREPDLRPGHGLVGLGERAHAFAGRVQTMSSAEGFLLRVELPALPTTETTRPLLAPGDAAGAAADGRQRQDRSIRSRR